MSAFSFGLGLTGAFFNFFGGLFLIVDSIRVRNKTLAQAGAMEIAKDEERRKRKRKTSPVRG